MTLFEQGNRRWIGPVQNQGLEVGGIWYIYYIFIPIYLYIYISISVYMYILYVYLWVYKCAWYFFIHIRYTFILGKIETQNLKPYILKPKVKNTEYNRIASVFVHSQLATNLVCVCYVWMWANVWAGANMDTHTHYCHYCCFFTIIVVFIVVIAIIIVIIVVITYTVVILL